MSKIKKLSNPILLAIIAVIFFAIAFCGLPAVNASAEGEGLVVATTLSSSAVTNDVQQTITVTYSVTSNLGFNSFVGGIVKPATVNFNTDEDGNVTGITAQNTFGLGDATITGTDPGTDQAITRRFAYEGVSTSNATGNFLTVTYTLPAGFAAGTYEFGLTDLVAYVWDGDTSINQTPLSITSTSATLIVRNVGTITGFSDTNVTYNNSVPTVAYTYNGQDQDGAGVVTTKWYAADGATVLEEAPVNAGTYKFGVAVAEGAKYSAVAETKVTVTIAPATIECDASDIVITATKQYTGSAVNWIEEDVTVFPDNTTVTSVSGGSTAVNAAVAVTVRLTAGSNYTFAGVAGDYKDFTKTVAVIQIPNSWTTNLAMADWRYGETPSVASATPRFGTPVFTYSNAENGEYTATVPSTVGAWYVKADVAGTDDYLAISAKLPYNITPAVLSYDADDIIAAGKTYTGEAQSWVAGDFTAPENTTVTAVAANSNTNAGSYVINVTLTAGANYTFTVDGLVADAGNTNVIGKSVAIAQATNGWATAPLAAYNKTWDGNGITVNAVANFGEVAVVYAVAAEEPAFDDQNPSAVGSYTVKITVAETDNYTGLSSVVNYAIAPALLDYTVDNVTVAAKVYTGSVINWVDADISGVPEYASLVADSVSGNGTNVGNTVSVVFTLRADGNHTFATTAGDTKQFTKTSTALILQATNRWEDGEGNILAPTGNFDEDAKPIYTAIPKFRAVGEPIFEIYKSRTGEEGSYVFGDKIADIDAYIFKSTETYYFRFTVGGTDNYTGLDTSMLVDFDFSAVVALVYLSDGTTAAAAANTLTYNGADQKLVVTSSLGYTSEFSSAEPWKNVGSAYSVTLSLTDGYVWGDGTLDDKVYTVTIGAKAITLVIEDKTAVYGTSQALTITSASAATICDGDTDIYSLAVKTADEISVISALTTANVGEYHIVGTDNSDNYTITFQNSDASKLYGLYTINAATLTDVSVAQSGVLTYNTTAQTPVVSANATAVNDQTVTFTYSNTQVGTYGAMLTFEEADTYTVYFKANAANHNEATGSFTVTLNPAKVTIPAADETVFVYNGAAQTYTLADGELYTVSGNLTATNAGTETITVSIDDKDNYIWDEVGGTSADKTYTFTISALAITITANNQTAAYTGEEATIAQTYTVTLTAGAAAAPQFVTDDITAVTITKEAGVNYGEYDLVPSAAVITSANTNYTITYANGVFSITKAVNTITFAEDMLASVQYKQALPYIGKVTATNGEIIYTFSTTQDGVYVSDIPVNVGQYYVKASVAESTNYAAGSGIKNFSITPVALGAINITYSDNSNLSWAEITEDANGVALTTTVSYTVNGEENTTRTIAAAAATYAIAAIPADTANYISSTATVNAYQVTFAQGEHSAQTDLMTLPESYYVFAGKLLTNPGTSTTADAVITGYAFSAWFDGEAAYDFDTAVTENIVLTATWVINKYTVAFSVNEAYGAVSAATVSDVDYGTSITVDGNKVSVGATVITATPNEDTAEYTYSFNNWTGVPESLKITANASVIANFARAAKTYSITYKVKVDAGSYETYGEVVENVAFGSAIAENVLTDKAWYTENYWFIDELMQSAAPETMSAANLTLYGAYTFNIGLGDINGNGIVNIDDITLYRKYIVGGYAMTVVEDEDLFTTEVLEGTAYFIKKVASFDSIDDGKFKGDAALDIRDVAVLRMAIAGGYGVSIDENNALVVGETAPVDVYKIHAGDSVTGITMALNGASTTEYVGTITLTESSPIVIKKNGVEEGSYKAAIPAYNFDSESAATDDFLAGTYVVYYQTADVDTGIYLDATTREISASYTGYTFCKNVAGSVNKASVAVTATRTNNTTFTVPSAEFTVADPDVSVAGSQNVLVSYNSFTAYIAVTVIDPAGGYDGYTLLGLDGDWSVGRAFEAHNTDEVKLMGVYFDGEVGVKVYHQGEYYNAVRISEAGYETENTNIVFPKGTYDLYYAFQGSNPNTLYVGFSTVTYHIYDTFVWTPCFIHGWYFDGTSDVTLTGAFGSKALTKEGDTDWYSVETSSRITFLMIVDYEDNLTNRSQLDNIDVNGEVWIYNGTLYTSLGEAEAAMAIG